MHILGAMREEQGDRETAKRYYLSAAQQRHAESRTRRVAFRARHGRGQRDLAEMGGSGRSTGQCLGDDAPEPDPQ